VLIAQDRTTGRNATLSSTPPTITATIATTAATRLARGPGANHPEQGRPDGGSGSGPHAGSPWLSALNIANIDASLVSAASAASIPVSRRRDRPGGVMTSLRR
jgi:hypothetical protein